MPLRPPRVHVNLAQNHMATTFELTISCESERQRHAENVLSESHRLIAWLEDQLTEFRETSPVFQLNHALPGDRLKMPACVIELLEQSLKLKEMTSESFSPSAKGTGGIQWDSVNQTAWRTAESDRIGFGAIGKGYALDQVRTLLEREGFHDFLLCAGGSSIVMSGHAAYEEPWSWGWHWGRKDEDGVPLGIAFMHPSGVPVAIGISGTHEKGGHLIDPREGKAASGPKSALVAHSSAAQADALSTALFVAGWNETRGFCREMPSLPALAVMNQDETPTWNGIFQELWGAPTRALALFLAFCATSRADEAVDLSSLGSNDFTPYITERNPWWALLPVLSILIVLFHLKKVRRNPLKQNYRKTTALTLAWFLISSQRALAVEFEPLGKAVAALLGTTKAFTKTVGSSTVYYAKDGSGKASRLVFIEKGVYEPDCTHTWAIGVSPATAKVTGIRVIEMSCPHAFPTRSASFLDQYKGKGPADLEKLEQKVKTIAKATGSSKLTNDAVKRTVTAAQSLKGKI